MSESVTVTLNLPEGRDIITTVAKQIAEQTGKLVLSYDTLFEDTDAQSGMVITTLDGLESILKDILYTENRVSDENYGCIWRALWREDDNLYSFYYESGPDKHTIVQGYIHGISDEDMEAFVVGKEEYITLVENEDDLTNGYCNV